MEKTKSYIVEPIPGPWHYKKNGFQITIGNESTRHDYLEHDYTVCVIEDNSFQAESNACLIAAAPDLLKQLKSAREMIASAMEKDDPLWFTQQEAALLDPIDEAISKAEGKE